MKTDQKWETIKNELYMTSVDNARMSKKVGIPEKEVRREIPEYLDYFLLMWYSLDRDDLSRGQWKELLSLIRRATENGYSMTKL